MSDDSQESALESCLGLKSQVQNQRAHTRVQSEKEKERKKEVDSLGSVGMERAGECESGRIRERDAFD